jgi:uncharacterized protein with FMN-binding domain
MALSSAAVLTVYAAGYVRTRPAADRLAAQAAERRPAPPPDVLARPSDVDLTAPPPAPALEPPKPAAPERTPKTSVQPIARAIEAPPDTTAPDPAPVASAPVVAMPASEPSVAATETKPVDPPLAAPAAAALPRFKDGTYFGWGSSRHGDIQASVVIEGGRIASATIAQCLTRYSCSWIAQLPPQVVSRQSPEVDYVSGATQSTNAFYYAVVDALSKAK